MANCQTAAKMRKMPICEINVIDFAETGPICVGDLRADREVEHVVDAAIPAFELDLAEQREL